MVQGATRVGAARVTRASPSLPAHVTEVQLKEFSPSPQQPGLSLHVTVSNEAWRAVVERRTIDAGSRTVRVSVFAGMRNAEIDWEPLPTKYCTTVPLPELAAFPGRWTVLLVGLDGRPYHQLVLEVPPPGAPATVRRVAPGGPRRRA